MCVVNGLMMKVMMDDDDVDCGGGATKVGKNRTADDTVTFAGESVLEERISYKWRGCHWSIAGSIQRVL